MTEAFWIDVACVVSAVVLTAAFLVHFVVLPNWPRRSKEDLYFAVPLKNMVPIDHREYPADQDRTPRNRRRSLFVALGANAGIPGGELSGHHQSRIVVSALYFPALGPRLGWAAGKHAPPEVT